MGRRPGRAAARTAAAALKNTPQKWEEPEDDAEDEVMADAPASSPHSAAEHEDAAEGSAQDSEAPSAPATPVPEAPVVRYKKRLGRPPKNKPPGWDLGEPVDENAPATPRRGRGRGGFRGGRGRGRGGAANQVSQQAIDNEGTMVDIVNDEAVLPEDPEGETKVDKLGFLRGDREYRCRTFTVLGRGERLYMLSTEPARCVGFRDSYLFFTKHRKLYKIMVGEEEKRDMIARDIIPHSYKGRNIGIVTARSVFREFGAQIIVGGKRIIDDYEVARLKAEGAKEGELADPNDNVPTDGTYNKNQYVAWHGASSVYHNGGPTVPMPAKTADGKKRRVLINDINWMLEHAREASRFNSELQLARSFTRNGVYDIHTNSMHYPKSMQPTHARWEPVLPSDPSSSSSAPLSALPIASSAPALTQNADSMDIDSAPSGEITEIASAAKQDTLFKPLPPVITRNFLVVDTVFQGPPGGFNQLITPGPDGDGADVGFQGLSSVPDDVRDCLNEEQRRHFDAAVRKEQEWKGMWSTEAKDGKRRQPVIDKGLFV